MADPIPAEIEAVKVLIAHTRIDIASCRCGWGSHAGNVGQSHALHVWRELQPHASALERIAAVLADLEHLGTKPADDMTLREYLAGDHAVDCWRWHAGCLAARIRATLTGEDV